MDKYNEEEQTLEKLATGNDQVWKEFYDNHRSAFRLFFIKQAELDPEDAITLFHEAMVIMHRKITNRELTAPLSSKLRTFLFGIGKMLLKKRGQNPDNWTDEIPDVPVEPESESIEEQQAKADFVRRLLHLVGEPCRELLEMHYIRGYVWEAVAREMNISNAGAARRRGFSCLEKLREILNSKM
ncbi:MAG TPA: sigma-70 family RNA polymerase sigma factor [Saprospiraceae bacterium]|nr:sigma-70 family RNA polymerase sigma factor [Saprospiraceae bacterium]HMQ82490.1 sigma-70 family RNA polymerase sigma factor [Saprospiraceae bacterium]